RARPCSCVRRAAGWPAPSWFVRAHVTGGVYGADARLRAGAAAARGCRARAEGRPRAAAQRGWRRGGGLARAHIAAAGVGRPRSLARFGPARAVRTRAARPRRPAVPLLEAAHHGGGCGGAARARARAEEALHRERLQAAGVGG